MKTKNSRRRYRNTLTRSWAQQQSLQSASSLLIRTLENKELSPSLPEHTNQEKGLKGSLHLSQAVQNRTYLLVHWLGYGLLGLALLDYLHIVIPPRLTDPVWEFQTMGALVEHSAVPLLGLIFVFYRYQGYVGKREKHLLRFLSWVSLAVGLVYLLMLPLGAADTWRIHQANNNQIVTQTAQQTQQLQQIKNQLNQATTDEQLKQLVASLAPQSRSLEIRNTQAFKDQLLAQVSQAEQNIQTQAKTLQNNQKLALVKSSVKWNLGALISGILFVVTWHLTSWARKSK